MSIDEYLKMFLAVTPTTHNL